MSPSNSKNFITLCCSDNEMFEIEEVVALQSQTIKHMIEDGCADNIIPLPNVQGKIFAKVVDYCNKHYTTDENNKDNDLKKWETQFLDVELPTLINLMHAANYLSVKGLLDLTGKAVADIIKKHSPEEIREIFKIKNDFTPQEELAVRRENQWALDDHEKKKKKKKKKKKDT